MREALLCVTVALLGVSLARAADPPPFAEGRDDSDQYVVETVASGLDHPTSVAVRPAAQGEERFDLFFSETGARRVLRWSTDRDHDPRPIITNFPAGEAPADETPTGPWGLDFLSRNRLAVGSGGLRGAVRVYSLPDDESELDYEAVDHTVGPVERDDESAEPDGFFMSMAHAESAFFVVARDGDSRGGILKATLDANRLAGLEAFATAVDGSDASGTRNPGRNPARSPSIRGRIITTSSWRRGAGTSRNPTVDLPCTARRAAKSQSPSRLGFATSWRWRSARVRTCMRSIRVPETPNRAASIGWKRRKSTAANRAGPLKSPRLRTRRRWPLRLMASCMSPPPATRIRRRMRPTRSVDRCYRSNRKTTSPRCEPTRMTRREKIEAMLADDPRDVFLRYSLAMELDKEGAHDAQPRGARRADARRAAVRPRVLHGRSAAGATRGARTKRARFCATASKRPAPKATPTRRAR